MRKGFSLLELLLVLALLALLLATLLPTVLHVRKRALEASALLFLKQVGQWVAALDTAEAARIQGQVACTDPLLQQEGAPGALPPGVESCQVTRDPSQNRYRIQVVAKGGRVFEADYWLR